MLDLAKLFKIGGDYLAYIKVREDENFENVLRRFKRKIEREGILTDLKKHEFFEKPCVKRNKKKAEARKRTRRQARNNQ